MTKCLSELDWDHVTIEPGRDEYTGQPEWYVYGHGEYDDSSVLAGQYRRCFLDTFQTVEEALVAYPSAEVLGHSTRVSVPPMPSCPPKWFDPADAGERWDEDY